MKIHEYQAKELFRKYNIPTDTGVLIENKVDELNLDFNPPYIIKAQIHSGGRGKAGGVKVAKTKEECIELVNKMFGSTLYTKQVPNGKVVNKVLITPPTVIDKEYYLSLTVDTKNEEIVIIASTEGGTEIEEVAKNNPSKIHQVLIPFEIGIKQYHAMEIIKKLGIKQEHINDFSNLIINMYNMFIELDCSLIEINPLVENDNAIMAIDAKVNFDDNALYRHQELLEYRDYLEEDPKELEASKYDLNFVSLDGNIGCLVNGAGLAMATMDIIKAFGGNPANFLDVGGSATSEKVASAFRILLKDPNIKAILVNIFGGIMKCDIIASGIVEAVKSVKLNVPLVVRLDGTNVDIGRKIIEDANLSIISAKDLHEAAYLAVRASEGKL